MLTQERLKELLRYDPATGLWTHANGDAAGWINSKTGYIRLQVDGRKYYAHRLAWLWMTGKWPAVLIDHKDQNPSNNRWDNLRPADKSKNGANRGAPKQNKSGWKGVSFCRATGRWRADITIRGKCKNLGRFDSPVAAHLTYIINADRAFGEFARAA